MRQNSVYKNAISSLLCFCGVERVHRDMVRFSRMVYCHTSYGI